VLPQVVPSVSRVQASVSVRLDGWQAPAEQKPSVTVRDRLPLSPQVPE
jgi:hypothetical protein